MNKHLLQIIHKYNNYELDFKQELIKKTREIFLPLCHIWVYTKYTVLSYPVVHKEQKGNKVLKISKIKYTYRYWSII